VSRYCCLCFYLPVVIFADFMSEHVCLYFALCAFDAVPIYDFRAPIDRLISRESSASLDLVGDRAAHPVCDH